MIDRQKMFRFPANHNVYREFHGVLESRTDTCGNKRLAEAEIHEGIFQGDALQPLLLVIAMSPSSHIRVAFNKFPDIFQQAFKIVVDMVLLYIL